MLQGRRQDTEHRIQKVRRHPAFCLPTSRIPKFPARTLAQQRMNRDTAHRSDIRGHATIAKSLMRLATIAMTGLLAAALPCTAFEFTTTFPAPRAQPPKIDGKIGEREWEGALRVALEGGGELLFEQDGTYLYVAIRTEKPGIASVCVDRGNTIAVLHASAALGTAEYHLEHTSWMRAKAFDWLVRDTSGSSSSRKVRQQFLASDGWYANTTSKPSTEREFQISLALAAEKGRIPLAIAVLATGDDSIAYWPEDLSDDCRNPDLIFGKTPDTFEFVPARWPIVKSEESGSRE